MSTIKFDPSNPLVIVLIIGGVWYLTRKRTAAQVAGQSRIVPQVPSSAPQKPDWAGALGEGAVTGLGKLFDGWLSGSSGSKSPIYNEAGTGPVDLTSYVGDAANNLGSLSDDLGVTFGGISPKFNWDNDGGSSFDGLPSLGTGLALA